MYVRSPPITDPAPGTRLGSVPGTSTSAEPQGRQVDVLENTCSGSKIESLVYQRNVQNKI